MQIQRNLQPLAILACNSANKPSFPPLPTDAILKMSLHFLHLWSIGQKSFLSDFGKIVYQLNYRPECPKVPDSCYFCIITIRYPYCLSFYRLHAFCRWCPCVHLSSVKPDGKTVQLRGLEENQGPICKCHFSTQNP